MKVKIESEVGQSCLTPSDPMDRSPPGSSVHGISQARALEWGAIAFSNRQGGGYPVAEPLSMLLAILYKRFYETTCVQDIGGLRMGLISIFDVLSK